MNRFLSIVAAALARPALLIGAVLFLAIAAFLFYWRPAWHCQRQQAALIRAIENNDERKLQRLISLDYRDRWDFNREGIILTIKDVRGQFISMTIVPREQNMSATGKQISFGSRFFVDGLVKGPGGGAVRQRINQLDSPMIFTWRRSGFLPSSWLLIELDNEAIPDDIWGYQPGSLQKLKLDQFSF